MRKIELIFLIIGMLACFQSVKAKEYGKTFTVSEKNTILNVEDFVLFAGAGGPDTITRVEVKNGVEFFIQLPEGHNVNDLSSKGTLEGDKIRVSKAGSLSFDVTIGGTEYYVLAHVNYYGVLQFQGDDAPESIDVTNENEDAVLGMPDHVSVPAPDGKIRVFWQASVLGQNNFFNLQELGSPNIYNMTLKELIQKIKNAPDYSGDPSVSEWNVRVHFSDMTSNGEYGESKQDITIHDRRSTATAPTITTSSLPNGKEGEAYNQQLEATGTDPISWSIATGNLPDGLSLSKEGKISGTPSTKGTFTIKVKAKNTAGEDEKEFTLIIDKKDLEVIAPKITTASLPNGKEGEAYSQQLEATGTDPISWDIATGKLPDGLSLSKEGKISGTPSTKGTFTIKVKAKNTAGEDEKEFTLIIDKKDLEVIAPKITTASLPNGKEGEAYSQQLEASGTNPISWSIATGKLPDGLSLSKEGKISGTPSTKGTFTVKVKAKNTAGEDEKEFTLIIEKKDLEVIAPKITTASLPNGKEGEAYNQQLEATGTTPISWSLVSGKLPDGLSLSKEGKISGTPSTKGTFTIKVKAKNTAGEDEKSFTINIIEKEVSIEEITTSNNIITLLGNKLEIENTLREKAILQIYSISSELLISKRLNIAEKYEVTLREGFYIILIQSSSKKFVRKIRL